jgi:hypothetical protein
MYGISPIIYRVTSIIIDELKKQYSKDKSNNIIINLSNLDLDDFKIDEILIKNSRFNSYDHNSSGIINGKYTSIIKLNLEELYIDSIVHELKHAYIDNLIYQNNGTPISKTKEVKEFYTDDLEKLLTKDLKLFPNLIKIIQLYYFSSFLEIPSFLENHNLNPDYIDYLDKANQMSNLESLKIDIKDLEEEFNLLITKYDIPFFSRFNTLSQFYEYSKKELNNRGKYIKRKIHRINYEKNVKKS